MGFIAYFGAGSLGSTNQLVGNGGKLLASLHNLVLQIIGTHVAVAVVVETGESTRTSNERRSLGLGNGGVDVLQDGEQPLNGFSCCSGGIVQLLFYCGIVD